MNQIKCSECETPRHIATNCFSKKNSSRKRAIKIKVTILDSSCGAYEDDCNFIVSVASKSIEDRPITNSQGYQGFENDKND